MHLRKISFAIFILIALLSFASWAQAAGLQLSLPHQARVGNTITIGVSYSGPQGSEDVSNKTQIDSPDLSPRGGNHFYVNFPRFPRFPHYSQYYSVTVYARYVSDTGENLTAQGSFWVDLTPDYIDIVGPWSVRAGSNQTYRAYGSYFGHREDLSNVGRWGTNYGSISNGMYYAPMQAGSASLNFSYGSKWQYFNINIAP